MKIRHRITLYSTNEEYKKFCLIQDEIQQKLELIKNVNIHTHDKKTYQPKGVIPAIKEIQIIGDTTEDNAKKIQQLVNEINQLITYNRFVS